MEKKPYIHGGDIYRNRVSLDFSVNINPLGMPEGSVRAAQEAILRCSVYPDIRQEELTRAISSAEGCLAEQVLPGNGAAELIYALCHAVLPGKVVLPAPCFQEYEEAARAAGGRVVYYDLKEEGGFAADRGLLSAIDGETALLFFCNPGNPVGTLADRELLLEMAERCESTGTWFCLDECFLPFLPEEEALSLKGRLNGFPHLIILRAFTKMYGMPGLRLGYALSANEALLGRMRAALQPWNVSLPAQAAGIAALGDREYPERTRRLIAEEKAYLLKEMEGLTERIYASRANFIFFRARRDLQERLLERQILIRSCSNYRNLSEGYFRIGVRTHEENRRLIRAWQEIERMER